MSLYVQRQLSAFVIPGGGSTMTASSAGVGDVLLDMSDTYPGNIMSVDDGNSSTGEVTIAASASQVLRLPAGYVSTHYLGIMISTTQKAKVVIVSPDHATGTQLVMAGTASAEEGFYSSQDTVTSITVTNVSASSAIVRFFLWTYPADITESSAWRSGTQTTGVL